MTTPLCNDCPDHEACMTGYPCHLVRPAATLRRAAQIMRDQAADLDDDASWDAGASLAVSRWLDSVATHWDAVGDSWLDDDGDAIPPEQTIDGHHAMDVALAYLGIERPGGDA